MKSNPRARTVQGDTSPSEAWRAFFEAGLIGPLTLGVKTINKDAVRQRLMERKGPAKPQPRAEGAATQPVGVFQSPST
jgi:hypothetical protein